jgi:hypothetical protein
VTLRDLAVVYLAIGVAIAIAIYRRSPPPITRALASAAVAVPLWPLWAPFAFEPSRARDAAHPLAARVASALASAEIAALGSGAGALLSRAEVARLAREVQRIGARLAELDRLLATEGFDLAASERRLAALEGARRASAEAHHARLVRLHARRAADAAGLAELVDLVHALRAELLLEAEGASGSGVADLVQEVSARLEALTETGRAS